MDFLIPIALIAAGVGLILVEVYLVPGFNVVGIVGVLLILFGVGYSFSEHGFVGGSIALVGASVAFGASFYWLWRSGAWDRFILATSLRRDDQLIARESEDRSRVLGQQGVAITPLRPTGIVDIGGRRIEVRTEGEFIAAGSEVRVVAMDRRQYFVRLANALPESNVSSSAD
ncbi:MAG: NfeD family protein [Rhodothermales bacterium]